MPKRTNVKNHGPAPYNTLYYDLFLKFLKPKQFKEVEENVDLADLKNERKELLEELNKMTNGCQKNDKKYELIRLGDKLRMFSLLEEALKSENRKGKYARLNESQLRCIVANLIYGGYNKERKRTILTVDNLLEYTFKVFCENDKYKKLGSGVTSRRIEFFEKKSQHRVIMSGHGCFDVLDGLYPDSPRKKLTGQTIKMRKGKIEVPKGLEFHFYCPDGSLLLQDIGHIIEGYRGTGELPEPYEIVREGEYVENYYLGYPHGLTININQLKDKNFKFGIICVPDPQKMVPLTSLLRDTRCRPPKEIHWVACREATMPWKKDSGVRRQGQYLYMKKKTAVKFSDGTEKSGRLY